MRVPTVLAMMLLAQAAPLASQPEQPLPTPTAARLRAGGSMPSVSPLVVGGGEVVLDVTVGEEGGVTRVQPLRATPPYTELMMAAVKGWRFDPARALVKGALEPADGHVLVLGVFRPPQVYAGPALGVEPKVVGTASPELPAPGALATPAAYPPRATRDGVVLIEIALTAAGIATGHRVMSAASPFDGAALETVRTWRFGFPSKPTGAETLYAYAIVGFREPITQ